MTCTAELSLKGATKEQLKEVIRLSEAYLETQATIAVAADQRAIAFSGFLVTAIIALLGASALAVNRSNESAMGWLALVGAIALLVPLFLSIMSASPVDFYFRGNCASEWENDIKMKTSYVESLAEQSIHYDKHIKLNNISIEKNAKYFRAAIWSSFSLVILGTLTFMAVFLNNNL